MIKSEWEETPYPRIRNLPTEEQEPFSKWLTGQTCPWIEGKSIEDQDAYYPWDYARWKKGLPVID